MRIEFVTQSSSDSDNLAATTERLVNFLPEPLPEGAQARFALKAVLGQEIFATITAGFIRRAENIPTISGGIADRPVIAAGGRAFTLSADGSLADRGAIADDPNTSISGNGGVATIAAGGRYFTLDGATLAEPTTGAFPEIGSVEYIGGYTFLTERGGRRLQWSALADPSSLPGLNFATAEARDDEALRGVAISGNIWIFKTTSIEIWGLTGGSGADAFQLIPGMVRETGLRSFGLITKLPGGAFFVGSDGIAYLASGTEIRPVSPPHVQTAIAQGEPTHCHYMEDEGNKLCTIRFRDRPAWVFNISTGLWHERASGKNGPWSSTFAFNAFGKWFTAEQEGRINEMIRTARDNASEMIRTAVSRPVVGDGGRFIVRSVEILGRVGKSDLGRQAVIMARATRDGGNTWGNVRAQDAGALGEYEKRVVFRNFGQSRTFALEIAISDPTDLTIYSSANVVAG